MIKYKFFQKNPASHYVYIDMEFSISGEEITRLQLPSWRPGRYELGNFAKNVKKVDVFNEKGEALSYKKTTKDLWEIDSKNAKSIKVTYSYYAAELNAGACFSDDSQIYMNPVHCCFYVVGREKENCEVHLQIPGNYKIACSLTQNENVLFASNFDELVESPFIASCNLQTESYDVGGVKFYLHFNGKCKPEMDKIKTDFKKFTEYQLQFWSDFPFDVYHFLFQITPFKFYHGVEHLKNTVIALGPGYDLHSQKVYEDLLGVSCHELFHAWNIKTIRPKEMLPYDYTKENYAETGFVYEGFTTYYGDKNLLSSDVFTQAQYFETLEERLDKHFHNFGRFNLSVTASSWDTWLDGYVPGAPYRKTNIYDEGSLIAFMLDVKIMEATGNNYSLKDVCRSLYTDFGKKGIGYTKEDIIQLADKISGISFRTFFDTYVNEASDFEDALIPCFNFLGLHLKKVDSPMLSEREFGFKTIENGTFARISLVAPYSPAWKAGLFANDDIIAVNGMVVRNNLNALLLYSQNDDQLTLSFINNEQLKSVTINRDKAGKTWFFKSKIELKSDLSDHQIENYRRWKLN